MFKRRLSRRMPHHLHFQWNGFFPLVPILLSLFPLVATGFSGTGIAVNLVGTSTTRRNPGTTKSSTTHLFADLSFSGDSKAFVELEASVDQVQEWLQTPSASDLHLLGTRQAKRLSSDPTVWECQQPRIDFMGLDLQPYFVHRVQRRSSTMVTVQVMDSRTDILNPNNPANQVVGALMGRAKFSGASRIQVLPIKTKKDQQQQQPCCRLVVDLTLNLHVPLPPFVLLPPGFNSVGSSIVSRTSKGRTEQLVQDLKVAYLEWAATKTESSTQVLEPKRQIDT